MTVSVRKVRLSRLEIQALGPPIIEIDGERHLGLRPLCQALLLYLAARDEPIERDALAALFWPEGESSDARAALRQILHALRKSPVGQWVRSDRRTIELPRHESLDVDVRRFHDLLRRAENVSPQGFVDGGEEREHSVAALEHLRQAVDLVRGDFLEGFSAGDSLTFDDWRFAQSESLAGQHRRALDRLVRDCVWLGELDQALGFSHRLLKADPYSEPALRRTMLLHVRMGGRNEALRQYRSFRERLRDELSVEPEEETEELYDRLCAGEEVPSEAFGNALTTAGALRLQCPAVAERPLPFVGRKRELSNLEGMLKEEDCRLVTIVGPGGVGKTRLAQRLANRLAGTFAQGCCFVPVATAETDLPEGVRSRLPVGFGEDGDLNGRLADYLSRSKLLLVVDFFEEVGTAAVEWIDSVTTASPNLRVVATSRSRLQLPSEWLLELGGLTLPAKGDASPQDSESLSLFLQCVRRVRTDSRPNAAEMEALAEVCRLCGGLPLAIELAASWMRMLSAAEVLEEVRRGIDFLEAQESDLPERHRSIRHVLDSSWKQLSGVDEALVRRLSIFESGFRLPEAQRIAGAGLAGLLRLVDRSLLQREADGRYTMNALLFRLVRERLRGRVRGQRKAHAVFLDPNRSSCGGFQRARLDRRP